MKAVKKIIALAVAPLLLAGCGLVSQAGAAAVVGDNRLTNDQAEAQFNSVLTALGDQQIQGTRTDIYRSIVSGFVFATLLHEVALTEKVQVTDSEVKARRAELEAQAGGPEALAKLAAASMIAPESIDRTIRMSTEFRRLTILLSSTASADDSEAQTAAYKLITSMSEAMNVKVSPRYGTWDANQLSVGALVTDMSLSESDLNAVAK